MGERRREDAPARVPLRSWRMTAVRVGVCAAFLAAAVTLTTGSLDGSGDRLFGSGIAGAAVGRGSSHEPLAAGPTPRSFLITGSVAGLYPGVTLPLVLTVRNPQHFKITVLLIKTTVATPSAGCAASNLAVGSFWGHLVVPSTSAASTSVHVTMMHSAPDACQGRVFVLHFAGVAVEP